MNIYKAIQKEQSKLISYAQKNGIYENFGQKEVGKLNDKYINSSSYTDEMNKARQALSQFNEWCMNYNI